MERKILHLDLSEQSSRLELLATSEYGRGLAMALFLREDESHEPGATAAERALVLVPGALTGTPMPCANRAIILSAGEAERPLQICSISGDFPQKFASLGLDALILHGIDPQGSTLISLKGPEVRLEARPDLGSCSCSELLAKIRNEQGREAAVVAYGPAARQGYALATLMVSYPEGQPRFTCPRHSFANVLAAKGCLGLVVSGTAALSAPLRERTEVQHLARLLSKIIVKDPICGGALPGLGSMTLLHLLKNRKKLPPLPPIQKNTAQTGERLNLSCAPKCVIACLNRHSQRSGKIYTAPEDAEVRAALERCFASEIAAETLEDLAGELSRLGHDWGLNTVEWIFAAALYLRTEQKKADAPELLHLFATLQAGHLPGRLLGHGSAALRAHYLASGQSWAGNELAEPLESQAEPPAALAIPKLSPAAAASDLERLHEQILIFENLGLCIFTAFALMNQTAAFELLAAALSQRWGEQQDIDSLIRYADFCLRREQQYLTRLQPGARQSIPEFAKVLHAYFQSA